MDINEETMSEKWGKEMSDDELENLELDRDREE